MSRKFIKIFYGITLFLFAWPVISLALSFPLLNNDTKIVGNATNIQLTADDDYTTIAQKFDIGYYELFEANPGIDEDDPPPETILIIPTQYVLPNELHNNIVVNVAEMRIYYHSVALKKVFVYPIGIGREGWNTPVGAFHIIGKIKDPKWVVPKSIFVYRARHGEKVPAVVDAGANNPMGKYAMRLSDPNYLIHGTDDPVGIGRRSSAGCIRLYPQDIEQLFNMVNIGTEVQIVNEPYKAAIVGDKVYFEAHMPLYEQRVVWKNDMTAALNAVKNATQNYAGYVDWDKVRDVANEHLGIPVVVGTMKAWKSVNKNDSYNEDAMMTFIDSAPTPWWNKFFVCSSYTAFD
jgi:L,D-transpeptidase ErfK/SrfK